MRDSNVRGAWVGAVRAQGALLQEKPRRIFQIQKILRLSSLERRSLEHDQITPSFLPTLLNAAIA